jgi:hypothetical protein
MLAAGLIGGLALVYHLTKDDVANITDDEKEKLSLTNMDKTLLMALQAKFPE